MQKPAGTAVATRPPVHSNVDFLVDQLLLDAELACLYGSYSQFRECLKRGEYPQALAILGQVRLVDNVPLNPSYTNYAPLLHNDYCLRSLETRLCSLMTLVYDDLRKEYGTKEFSYGN